MSKIINYLDSKLNDNLIEQWFEYQYQKVKPCLYSSVDLRHSGNKLVAVDTNLFPAGFNNFNNPQILKLAANLFKQYINKYNLFVDNILLIAEDHTRNKFYLDNLNALQNIINYAGFNCDITMFSLDSDTQLETYSNGHINCLKPLIKQDKIITSKSNNYQLIILNNDLSNNNIIDIVNKTKQQILPSTKLGWYFRQKSNHFEQQHKIIDDFAKEFALESFLLKTAYSKCGKINFSEKNGLDCIALAVEKLIYTLRKQYQKYEIKDQPYVFIKANQGTYGMGIMTATCGEDIYRINKKSKNKMHKLKGGVINTNVIIQEGVKTTDKFNNNTSEPMVYLINGISIGAIYRVNKTKNAFSNLNSPGMYFEPIHLNNKIVKYYELIARLASLAASYE